MGDGFLRPIHTDRKLPVVLFTRPLCAPLLVAFGQWWVGR